MARKIPKPQQTAATAPAQEDAGAAQNAREHDILHPERTREIGGRLVEMREYGYIEGNRVQAAAAVFLADLFGLFPRHGHLPTDAAINDVIARHITVVHWMMAQAMTPYADDLQAFGDEVQQNVAWIAQLDYEQGEQVKALWWAATSGFFFRLLKSKKAAEQAEASRSASAASTTP